MIRFIVQGREIVVIANDITHNIGTFGPREDVLFLRASELARRLRVPRIYLSANSGARIGLSREILSLFKIAWEDPNDPERGFKYLYLTSEDYKQIANCSKEPIVQAELIRVRARVRDF